MITLSRIRGVSVHSAPHQIAFAGPPRWMSEGRCVDLDPDIFFPNDERSRQSHAAKRICHSCPVVTQCAEYAMTRPELTGIWGGLTYAERRRLRWGR